jgi:oligopeptidase A
MNPLLDFSGLPRFADFKVEHVSPAVDSLLEENRALVTQLTAAEIPTTWNEFVEPLEDANERLGRDADSRAETGHRQRASRLSSWRR